MRAFRTMAVSALALSAVLMVGGTTAQAKMPNIVMVAKNPCGFYSGLQF